MKSLRLLSPGVLRVGNVPIPEVRAGELLVKMKCSGVCGTDLEKVSGEAITPPVLGHEVVGTVSKVGKGLVGFSEGDRVFVHHHAPCYRCALCKRGEYTLCDEFPKHNIRPGGFAEFFAVPAWNVSRGAVLKLPSRLSFEEASFIEPLGCCVRGLEKVGAQEGSTAVIYGAGPVGLTHLVLLRLMGYSRIVVSDPSRFRLGFARKLKANATYVPSEGGEKEEAFSRFGGGGPDLAVVATGSPAAFSAALGDVRKGGKVLLFGAPPRGSSVDLDMPMYFLRGVTVVPSYSTSEVETKRARNLLSSGRVSLSSLVTNRFALDEAPEAFRSAKEQKCLKAVVCV